MEKYCDAEKCWIVASSSITEQLENVSEEKNGSIWNDKRKEVSVLYL